MNTLILIGLTLASVCTHAAATKNTKREPASIDVESKMLRELERTLETRVAEGEERTIDEAAILNRPNVQASDRPQYREDY